MSGADERAISNGSELWVALREGLNRGDLQPGRDLLAAGHPTTYAHPNRDDCVIREYPDGRRKLVRYDAGGEHIVGSPDERSWQLAMSGHGLEHVTAELRHDMAHLLDLLPSVSHLTIDTDDGAIHVARDWPSDRIGNADRLAARIAQGQGISAIVVHDRDGETRRINAASLPPPAAARSEP